MPDDDKSEECESCGYTTDALKNYPTMDFRATPSRARWLCELCASTPAGNANEYPEQYEGQVAILRTVCFVGNTILAAIKAKA